MTDTFENYAPGLDSFGYDCFAITPNDSTDLNPFPRYLYIGGTGNIAVETMAGNTVTFSAHPVGYFPQRVRKVLATGTTATNIVGIV